MEENSQELTLFAVGSLASPSATRGSGRGKTTNGGYGRSSHESFAYYDRDTCSWKTYQGSLTEEWTTYSESFPPSGTTRNGRACRRRPLVPRTSVTGSSSWPTPDTAVFTNGAKMRREALESGNKHAVSLHHAVHLAERGLWPTPQAHDAAPGNPERVGRYGTKHGGRNLNDEVALAEQRMWPTPVVEGNRNKASYSGKSGDGLQTAVGGGALNPTWVEWLMGFPEGWTDLED
jgi:hypothetical protein